MARPIKDGIDYFPFDVGFFTGKRIKILKARYGNDGISLYIYLLCEIYKSGYYLKIDDDFNYIISEELHMSYAEIGQILNFLLERSLFDDKLFKSDKVLTSNGIQKRFQEAVKTRAIKNPIEVDRFWILSPDETHSFIKANHSVGNSENNPSNSKNNPKISENNDIKESKEKKSKVKESKENSASAVLRVYELYNQICKRLAPVKLNTINSARDRATLYLLELYGVDKIAEVFSKAAESDFLASSRWCKLEWIIKQDNFAKIDANQYANKQSNKAKGQDNSFRESSYDLEELDNYWDKPPELKVHK